MGAYHHGGDTDSEVALQAYPPIEGAKLDSCALCQSGDEYEKKPEVMVKLGSCQWCHYSYGYDQSGDIAETLNSYGDAYNSYGRGLGALNDIEHLDFDEDCYANVEEIGALRYPGNAEDDPAKVSAPFRVVTMGELSDLPQQTQILLMNTHKSGDFYAEYSGVRMADLLDDKGVLRSAKGLTVFAPDGFTLYHPFEPDTGPLMYYVYGSYPEAFYYYDAEADNEITKYS